jgi:phage shock protein C
MITVMNGNNESSSKRLLRVREGRIAAGVCSGLAAYFGIDVNLVRLAFGVLTFCYALGIVAYLIAWAVLPEAGEDGSILESFVNKYRR